MEKINFKNEIEVNKKAVLFILITGLLAILGYLFIPFVYMTLIIAIIFFVIGIDYYKKNKGKGKKKQLFAIFFISVLNFSIFIASFVMYQDTYASMTYNDDGMQYTQTDTIWSAETFFNDNPPTDDRGIIGGNLYIPQRNSIYHRVPRRRADYLGLEYEIEVKTGIKFKSDLMHLEVYGQDSDEYEDEDRVKLNDTTFLVHSGYSGLSGSLYNYGGNITIRGDENFEYYTFVVWGEIEENQEITTTFSLLIINNTIHVSDDQWGYTTSPDYTTQEALNIQLDKWGGLVVLAVSMLVAFIILFLSMYFLGNIDKVIHFLFIMTGCGLLVLLIMMADARNTPVIKELIDIIDSPAFQLTDVFGIWASVKTFLLIIGMVIAFIIWAFIMGSVLALCWGLWYIWNTLVGSLGEQIAEAVGLREFK
jgi:hypothetical protein